MGRFKHDIAGGQGNLTAGSFQSPNFTSGSTGWQVTRDGNSEFNNGTFRGTVTASTFEGTDFEINADGAFFYTGTPTLGNLFMSVAPVAGTDSYGNAYPSGLYVSNGTIKGSKVSGGTITGTTISGGTVKGTTIDGGTITGTTVDGGTISGTTISGGTISGGSISGATISGGSVEGSTVVAGGAYGGGFIVQDSSGNVIGQWDATNGLSVSNIGIGGAIGAAVLEVTGGAHMSGNCEVDGSMITNGATWPQTAVSQPSLTSPTANEIQLASAINGIISRLQSVGLIA